MRVSFNERLAEFISDKNLNKFSYKDDVRFKDGAKKYVWFIANKNKIILLNNEESKEVFNQLIEFNSLNKYNNNVSKNIRMSFDQKLIAFEKETNLNKFKFADKSVRFEDGTVMGPWFSERKNKLFNMNTNVTNSIKKQFEEYESKRKFKFFNDRVEEFISIKNSEKFNINKTDLRFIDGVIVSYWFQVNKNKILNSNDTLCNVIKQEYEQFLNTRNENHEKWFNDYVQEFEKEENVYKFDSNNKEIKFSNGVVMSSWFFNNKKSLLNSNSGYTAIKKQYDEYKKTCGKKNMPFELRLVEFEKEENMLKFKTSGNVKFKDGCKMDIWFKNNVRKIIKMSNDAYCISILLQYERYVNEYKPVKKYTDILKVNKRVVI